MLPPWRYHLKTAQQALAEGRVEDALATLHRERLTEYGPGEQLRMNVGQQFARRAGERANAGDLAGGWQDVRSCEELLGSNSAWSQAVGEVLQAELAALARHWQAGNFKAAWDQLTALGHNTRADISLETLQEVSRRLESAHKLQIRGKFAEADEQYAAAFALRNDLPVVSQLQRLNRQNQTTARELEEQLHRALTAQDWSTTLTLADAFLALAPQCHLARDARRRAWGEVGASLGESDAQARLSPPEATADDRPISLRFLLWIDAVGGYLVCLGNELILGQAQPQGAADIPLQADISRAHARIVRDAEGYLLEPLAPTLVNGKEAAQTLLLNDGDILELGAVRLAFRNPHALSSSARLDFLSRHRTHPYADGVVLMAESCVLGASRKSHIVCRGWRKEVVFMRQGDELFCRGGEKLEIDGTLTEGRGRIDWNSTVVGSDFTMKLEQI